MSKLAVKRLSASDLTLFQWHFVNRPAGNQKAINLNADVFVDQLYPSLPSIAPAFAGKLTVDLFLYGPGFAGEYNLQRKIIKRSTYKNWRLNGEFIFNPEQAPARFNSLQPDDVAVLEFSGPTEVHPTSVRALFVARAEPADAGLHRTLSGWLGTRRMAKITQPELNQAVSASGVDSEHPVLSFALDSAIEDAALGGIEGVRALLRRSHRRISRTELQRAREEAEEVGRIGEEFVNSFLLDQVHAGVIQAYRWDADENAVSPFDFSIVTQEGTITSLIDVKATAGEFGRRLHISASELAEMATGRTEYRIYRVFDASSVAAKLRISHDLTAFARSIHAVFEHLPRGVRSDGVAVDPTIIPFEEGVISLTQVDEPE